MNVYIFGDSIMRGVLLDGETDKYFTMPSTNFEEVCREFSLNIENKSRFGYTLPKGSALIDKALEGGIDCSYALVEFGGNDCSYDWAAVSQRPDSEHKPLTPLETFEKLYRQTIQKLKNANIIPVLMTLPPIDAQSYVNWVTRGGNSKENIVKWLGDEFMMYRWQELYSNMVAKVAQSTKSLCVDIRSAFLERHDFKKLLCRDGIHPNEAGHAVIKNKFEDFLKKTL